MTEEKPKTDLETIEDMYRRAGIGFLKLEHGRDENISAGDLRDGEVALVVGFMDSDDEGFRGYTTCTSDLYFDAETGALRAIGAWEG